MAKLDRLLNLTAALLDAQLPMTAEDIRTKVPGYSQESDEAFRRAFERDKDDLREMGVPIETVGSAYTIERDVYELPDPGFEPDELAALHLAATTVQLEGLDPDDADEGLRKLGGIVSARPSGSASVGAVPTPESLLDLFVAVIERRVATFDYNGSTRSVQPLRLQFERGRWYLTAHDLERDDRRSFRLDRIDGAVHTGEPGSFDSQPEVPGVRLRPWEFGIGGPERATVLLDADVAGSVLTEFPDLEVVDERQDGSVVVALEVRNRVGLRNFVLSLLDRAELLEPVELREDLVDWLASFATGTAR